MKSVLYIMSIIWQKVAQIGHVISRTIRGLWSILVLDKIAEYRLRDVLTRAEKQPPVVAKETPDTVRDSRIGVLSHTDSIHTVGKCFPGVRN